jgi:hypothetical protein
VLTDRCDLEGPARQKLTADPSQVDHGVIERTRKASLLCRHGLPPRLMLGMNPRGLAPTPQPLHYLSKARRRNELEPKRKGSGFAQIVVGKNKPVHASSHAAQQQGEDAPDRMQATVEPELSGKGHSIELMLADLLEPSQQRHRHGQIECRAIFPKIGRGQIDGDARWG